MKAEFAAILAAGRGARMNSASPAALMRILARSLAGWAVEAVSPLCESIPVVVEGPGREIEKELGMRARYAVQETPAGTADALRRALEAHGPFSGLALVAHANIPLIGPEHYTALVGAAAGDGAAALVCTDEETSCVRDAGAWCFSGRALEKAFEVCPGAASVAELAAALRFTGARVRELPVGASICLAAADRESLASCERELRLRIAKKHFENGVTIRDPESVWIGPEVKIGRDAELYPGVSLMGATALGEGTVIGTGCALGDTFVGDRCELVYVVANGAKIGNNVKIGPFVNLRPGTVLADNCKVGDFVEVKNSVVGRGSKLPHLSYVGDADIGERVNVGCGAVFVNYDGFEKHRTVVGDDVFLGCQTNLVAPVRVGDGAYTAAGSTITRDVPACAMAIARARQENKEGYAERLRALKRGE
ncbi:MAG: Bifunctional protein GlmU [Firmicutes bacterium ADurb.Bin248]|nr:MAG: Bifunctional protein GlmU [Firmicutes bacterium ADurb.Bin248]HOF99469.1 NTP transferase domain-containing protein [Clostridia bacterium]HPK16304.1 NTP transferase domain-containing protein [Clostridia bacterium]